jgi:hypothetical protein
MQSASKAPNKPSRRPPSPNKPSRQPLDQVRGVELANSKRKIRSQKDEIHKLKQAIRDYKAIIADAKRKGFSHN